MRNDRILTLTTHDISLAVSRLGSRNCWCITLE